MKTYISLAVAIILGLTSLMSCDAFNLKKSTITVTASLGISLYTDVSLKNVYIKTISKNDQEKESEKVNFDNIKNDTEVSKDIDVEYFASTKEVKLYFTPMKSRTLTLFGETSTSYSSDHNQEQSCTLGNLTDGESAKVNINITLGTCR